MAHEKPISVWIVEDHHEFRATIQDLLNGEDGLSCPLAFASCESMLKAIPGELVPDVVLMDIEIPDHMSGIDGVAALRRISTEIRVVMLTVHSDDDIIFDALCAGASGYLLKYDPPEKVLEAVIEAHQGGVVMSAQIAQRVLTMFKQYAVPNKAYNLTRRELDVLELLVKGLKKQAIADELCLAFATIDSHMRSIYSKLHVHSRTEAVVKALKERLI